MTDKQKEKCSEILEYYGFENQREILIEECAELIQSVSKAKRSGEKITDNFIEELADVSIMIEQMKQAFNCNDMIRYLTYINRKIKRQMARIKGIPERNCTNCVFAETCSKESGYCGNWRPNRR